MNLHDLHPASWYSMAWYPIYRIPEGNFRAAFLTYHSLGHFLHQSSAPDKAGDFTHIVCPVVGLQSYNAKKKRLNRQKKTKEYDLSSLAEFLPDLSASQHPADATNAKLNCRSRKKLLG
ncbi:uncharacterized protein M6B38_332040 [Iris pallida]|uniref:Uncharacterized protein n=1 Tax=Iris pallida TaxID=29817 RepID=A0AAX6H4X8_IRIPA|nr:uncharacterized protein M6B38_332040 [Iris pallida]